MIYPLIFQSPQRKKILPKAKILKKGMRGDRARKPGAELEDKVVTDELGDGATKLGAELGDRATKLGVELGIELGVELGVELSQEEAQKGPCRSGCGSS